MVTMDSLTAVTGLIANQDKFVVFRNTAEAVGSTIALLLIKCNRRDEGRVALAPGDDALFPG